LGRLSTYIRDALQASDSSGPQTIKRTDRPADQVKFRVAIDGGLFQVLVEIRVGQRANGNRCQISSAPQDSRAVRPQRKVTGTIDHMVDVAWQVIDSTYANGVMIFSIVIFHVFGQQQQRPNHVTVFKRLFTNICANRAITN
jgi:hypothetical protein